MLRPSAACTALVTQLKAAGFSATVDPELLDPPAVWVQPRGIRDLTLAGGATLSAWLYLIVGGHETEHAMTLLDDLLAELLAGLPDLTFDATSDEVVDMTAAVLLPGHTQAMPAYRLAIELDLGDDA